MHSLIYQHNSYLRLVSEVFSELPQFTKATRDDAEAPFLNTSLYKETALEYISSLSIPSFTLALNWCPTASPTSPELLDLLDETLGYLGDYWENKLGTY